MKNELQTPNTGSGLEAHPEQLSDQNAALVKQTGKAARGNVYDQITERIIAMLEQGKIPWQKPWSVQSSMPRNLISKKPYRGINVFLLLAMGYESPFWLTFHQVQQLGGKVRKGEKACPVVFWKQTTIEDKQTGEKEEIRLLRFYYVFNLAQCEGIESSPAVQGAPLAEMPLPADIVERMPNRPEIKQGMTQAFYSPRADFVGIPLPERFQTPDHYFAILFHELIHSTGHQSRLNRPTITETAGFGTNPYCKEELIAEMGAAFLCGQAGITERTIDNSAAYLQHWLAQLKNDRTLIVSAAAQAQKAADYILGTKFEERKTEDAQSLATG